MGRVFVREGKGHQFNQNYLDNMFPLDGTREFVRGPGEGDFMDMDVIMGGSEILDVGDGNTHDGKREGLAVSLLATRGARVLNESPTMARGDDTGREGTFWSRAKIRVDELAMVNGDRQKETVKVKHLRRLWAYRNGGVPPACHDEN